jgi:Leucine Rich repeat
MVEGGGLRHITALSLLRSLDLTGCVRLTNKGAELPAVDMRDRVCVWASSGSEQGTKCQHRCQHTASSHAHSLSTWGYCAGSGT